MADPAELHATYGPLKPSGFPTEALALPNLSRDALRKRIASVDQALAKAFAALRSGDLRLVREIADANINSDARHPDALYLRGVVAIEDGHPQAAEPCLRFALEAFPGAASFHNAFGVALDRSGLLKGAERLFIQALRADPDLTAAGNNLAKAARTLARQERPHEPGDKKPGKLVLGIGTGRSGSTSLVRFLERHPSSFVSHERPPRLKWSNTSVTRLNVHLSYMRILAGEFGLVADVAHWWLPYLEQVFDTFPDAKVVGLKRRREETIASFERIKGTLNHWTTRYGKRWERNAWDECYPSYDTDDRPDAIGRYWDEYYLAVDRWAERYPGRVVSMATEALSTEAGLARLITFLDLPSLSSIPFERFNASTTIDGKELWGRRL